MVLDAGLSDVDPNRIGSQPSSPGICMPVTPSLCVHKRCGMYIIYSNAPPLLLGRWMCRWQKVWALSCRPSARSWEGWSLPK